MQTKFKLASRLIVAMLAMCTHFAYAAEDSGNKSFEDGLVSVVPSAKKTEFELNSDSSNSDRFESLKEFEGGMHVTMVPEPATDAMVFAGLVVLLVAARRKQAIKGS